MWKRSMAGIVRHRQTKEPETDRPSLNHRATSRLYPWDMPTSQSNSVLAIWTLPTVITNQASLETFSQPATSTFAGRLSRFLLNSDAAEDGDRNRTVWTGWGLPAESVALV